MESFKDMFIITFIVGLFVFSMMAFVVNLQTENGNSDTIRQDPILNNTYNYLELNLSDGKSEAQTQKENFESEKPERGFGDLIIFAIVGVIQKFFNLIVVLYNILVALPVKYLGVPKVVVNVFSTIILTTGILLAWRAYRSGS